MKKTELKNIIKEEIRTIIKEGKVNKDVRIKMPALGGGLDITIFDSPYGDTDDAIAFEVSFYMSSGSGEWHYEFTDKKTAFAVAETLKKLSDDYNAKVSKFMSKYKKN